MSKDVVVSESVRHDQPSLRVDREKSTVHDVKIAGLKSKNRRRYTDKAYQEALHLYNNVTGNADHPANFRQSNPPNGVPSAQVSEQPWIDTFCKFTEPYYKPGDGVYAKNMICNPDHPATKPFLWLAEHAPHKVVLSQVVAYPDPGTSYKGGDVLIDHISRVISVDVIGGNGGTNRTLFEGATDTMNELEMLGQSVKDLFPSDTAFSDVKTAVTKAVKSYSDIPTTFSGTVAEALSALNATSDPRVRVIVEELDRRNIDEAARQRRDKATQACKDAKLPESVVSEVFIGSLLRADDNDWKSLIDDRRSSHASKLNNPPRSADGADSVMTLDKLCQNVKANK
jgi:hypothetical protein